MRAGKRMDVFNGLLLAAHLDAAFDAGLIMVGSDGSVLASPTLPADAADQLGLAVPRQVTLQIAHGPYLAWHGAHVLRP